MLIRTKTQTVLSLLCRNTALHIALLTLIIGCMQWYNRNIFGDPDAQYHLTVAKLMPLWPTSTHFFWLPFTSWGTGYADQHYLFHLFLKPFALFNMGQLVIVAGFLLNITAFNWLLKQATPANRVPWLWLYALGSTDLLTRINLVKAEATGLVFIYILTGLLIRRKWMWLLPLMSLYTLWYGGSTLFLLILGAYCAVELFQKRTILLKPVYGVLLGLLLAVALHPYRATLPALLYDQITRAGLLRVIPGGNEWYSQPSAFLPDNILVFLPWAISLMYVIKTHKRIHQTTWFIALTGCILLCLALYSNRITLYWVPYAILLAATVLPDRITAGLKHVFTTSASQVRKALVILLIMFACARGLENAYDIATIIHRIGLPIARLRSAAEWLEAHTQPGDVVTNTSWHIFPELLYWNTTNRYIAGEDPAFLWIADQDRYTVWKQLENKPSSTQYVTGLLAFQSVWLITSRHELPTTIDERLKVVYTDNAVTILHLAK